VTLDDVHRVANAYISPEKMAMVIVGDAGEILAQAEPYADSVEIFDTEGKPKNVDDYRPKEGEETAQVAGKWGLKVDFQGRQLPVSLVLEQNGDQLSGKLETMLGDGEIAEGKVKGNKVSALARAEMQGQAVEFSITGAVDGDSMSGTLSAPIVPEALPFTGTRED
jgi:predicted Zn-dependent peptidase